MHCKQQLNESQKQIEREPKIALSEWNKNEVE